MLPAQGLFRSHPCPFFLAGLCERPHCYFRHCASDIKIDRKLEAQALEDSFKPETSEKARTSSSSGSSRRNSCAQRSKSTSSKDSSASTVSKSNDKKEETTSSRLTTDKPAEAQSTRKRSCDLENTEPAKRLKPNEESESDTMGSAIGKLTETIKQCSSDIASVFRGSTSDSSNTSNNVEDDIDKIVAEIEGIGKKSSPSSHRSHKSHKHKHRKSDRDSERHSSSKSKNDSSHRTSDRKENKSSSNNDSRNSGSHHREKDEKKDSHRRSRDSESSSSSSRHHKSSHKDKDKDSSKHSEKSGKSHQSSSNSHKDERRSSKTSESSRDTSLDTLRSVQNSIDVQNRFDALVQSAASNSNNIGSKGDESFSEFDAFDDSLDFKYAGSDSDEDPEDIARECREMFENYKPEDEPRTSTPLISPAPRDVGKMDERDEGFCVVASKKRVAHANASVTPSSSSSSPLPPKKAPGGTSLHEAVFKRFEQQNNQNNQTLPRQQSEPQKSNNTQRIPTSTSAPAFTRPKGKQRIAHVPNASALAKRPVVNQSSKTSTAICNGPLSNSLPGKPGALTYSQTAAKGTKREAHQPSANVTQQVKPLVIKDAINKGSKIPHGTRQRIMDSLYTEFCQILGNPQQAFETTIKKEDELYSKHTSKHIYYNAGVAVIAACRSQRANNGSSIVPNRVVSHEDILTGSLVAKNCSVLGTRKNDTLPQGAALYQALRKYIMTEQQLIDNGYPRPHPSGTRGKATAKPRIGDENLDMTLTLRKCDRCRKKYQTTEDGDHIGSELCNYHWGRKFSQMSRAGRGARESTYTCCGSDDDKLGCATAVCHVSKSPISISEQKGFVEAVLDEGVADGMGKNSWDIIGIDCEMVYTTHGNELARVTVVDVNSVVLYDEKVKPTHRVLDCNTRFSGLTFEDLEQATKGITEIQAILLARIRPNTIIIGHSLESDLIALRLIHDCVIDTSVLYPHRMGPPKKRALKTLSSEYLKKVIQESLHGHDSAEDAQIAVELVLAKLKTDGRK